MASEFFGRGPLRFNSRHKRRGFLLILVLGLFAVPGIVGLFGLELESRPASGYKPDEVVHRPSPDGSGRQRIRKITHLGYLTPEEAGYVLAKVTDTRRFERDAPPRAKSAYKQGRDRLTSETQMPPRAESTRLRKALYATRRAAYAAGRKRFAGETTETGGYKLEQDHVTFRCSRCTQQIRVPLDQDGQTPQLH